MTIITTRIIVTEDGTISGKAPPGQVPPGEHDAAITVTTAPRPPKGKPFTMDGLKMHDVPWDGSVSLHREDLYDDEGRLR